jgi:hypothetical protein
VRVAGRLSRRSATSTAHRSSRCPHADASVDAVRASHVLEHFPRAQVPAVIGMGALCSSPAASSRSRCRISRRSRKATSPAGNQNTDGYLMGGQIDDADFHKALFDDCGAEAAHGGGRPDDDPAVASELPTTARRCRSRSISRHQAASGRDCVSAVMSVPRLGFMDNFFAAFEALPPLRIKLRRYTGAFWSQCIERVIEETIAQDKPDAILTLDYDTVFRAARWRC